MTGHRLQAVGSRTLHPTTRTELIQVAAVAVAWLEAL